MRISHHRFYSLAFSIFGALAGASCDASLPTRELPAGDCIQESDCSASGQVCKANQCVACTTNSDCASQLCDVYGDSGGAGKCLAPATTFFIDNNEENLIYCNTADGTARHPFCDVAAALAVLPATATTPTYIRVLASGSAYGIPALQMTKNQIVLSGPGSTKPGQAATLITATGDSTMQIGSGANVVIDGFVLSLPGLTVSSGATLTIRRSSLNSLTTNATFTGATVTLDRVLISENYAGLTLDGGTLNMTNCVLTDNSIGQNTNLIDLIGGSGSFQFNTAVKNVLATPTAQVIGCSKASTVSIKNSILAQNGVSQQLSAACSVVAGSIVVGASDSATGQIKQDPSFVDPAQQDLRLKAFDPVNMQYVIDKAVGVNASDKNVGHDFYGTARPQGAGYDIGAVEFSP